MSSGCGDVLSLEDLKTAKKHQTFEAEVITGHAGGVSSGAEIDTATNLVTGQVQKTMPAILRDIGFDPEAFDFTTGGTVTARDTVVYNPADNNWYSWAGALPHVVAAGTDPTTDSNWKPRTDQLLRQNLSAQDGFRLIGKVPSVSALSSINGASGDSVLVTGYYSGSNLGGGEFYWDQAQVSVNNGVTIFNGWVRKVIDGVLSSYDVGLIPGDGTDATSKLLALTAAHQEGWTIDIYGYHQISGPITIKDKTKLTLRSRNATISGYERRDSWVWGSDPDFEYGSGNIGLFSLSGCAHTVIEGFTILGAHIQRPDSKEWGDCMVRYESCPDMTVRNNYGANFGGWGIFALYSDRGHIHGNFITNVSRQSGINAFACSSYSKVHDNTVINAGLYGVELETFPSKPNSTTYGNEVYNNVVRDCKFGITIVGNHNDASVHSNTVYGCKTAIFAIRFIGGHLSIKGNSLFDNMRGVQVNASSNVEISDNSYDITTIPGFVLNDQYNSVIDIKPSKLQFYSINGIGVGNVISIRGVAYTVTATAQDPTRTDYGAQSGGLYLNTVSTALASDVEHCDNVLVSVSSLSLTPYGFAIEAEGSAIGTSDSISNVRFVSNVASGLIAAGLFSAATYTSYTSVKEWWVRNKIISSSSNPYTCRWFRFQNGAHNAMSINGNTYDKTASVFASSTGGATDRIAPKKTYRFEAHDAINPGSTFIPHHILPEGPFAITGIRVVLYNYSSTAPVILEINAGTSNTIQVAAANASTVAVTTYNTNRLFYTITPSGVPFFRLSTSGNVAAVSSYFIEIDTI